jgi:hypothetical protein
MMVPPVWGVSNPAFQQQIEKIKGEKLGKPSVTVYV